MINLALQLGRDQQLTPRFVSTGETCYLKSLSQNHVVICARHANKTALPSSKL